MPALAAVLHYHRADYKINDVNSIREKLIKELKTLQTKFDDGPLTGVDQEFYKMFFRDFSIVRMGGYDDLPEVAFEGIDDTDCFEVTLADKEFGDGAVGQMFDLTKFNQLACLDYLNYEFAPTICLVSLLPDSIKIPLLIHNIQDYLDQYPLCIA